MGPWRWRHMNWSPIKQGNDMTSYFFRLFYTLKCWLSTLKQSRILYKTHNKQSIHHPRSGGDLVKRSLHRTQCSSPSRLLDELWDSNDTAYKNVTAGNCTPLWIPWLSSLPLTHFFMFHHQRVIEPTVNPLPVPWHYLRGGGRGEESGWE